MDCILIYLRIPNLWVLLNRFDFFCNFPLKYAKLGVQRKTILICATTFHLENICTFRIAVVRLKNVSRLTCITYWWYQHCWNKWRRFWSNEIWNESPSTLDEIAWKDTWIFGQNQLTLHTEVSIETLIVWRGLHEQSPWNRSGGWIPMSSSYQRHALLACLRKPWL
jgi:hypothetical protein